jgi:hypothetical protein
MSAIRAVGFDLRGAQGHAIHSVGEGGAVQPHEVVRVVPVPAGMLAAVDEDHAWR